MKCNTGDYRLGIAYLKHWEEGKSGKQKISRKRILFKINQKEFTHESKSIEVLPPLLNSISFELITITWRRVA